MKCNEAERLIILYSALQQSEKSEVDEHVNRCARCLELFRQQTMYWQVLNQVKTQEPRVQNSARLTSQIMSRIHPAASSGNWLVDLFSWMRIPITVAAMVLLLAGFVELQETTLENGNWVSSTQTGPGIHQFFRDYSGKSKPVSRYQTYRSKSLSDKNEIK